MSDADRVRVLVVDDDFRVASIHRHYVERLVRFEVVGEAYTAASALEFIRATPPDLILLDMYLPDFSGLQLMLRLMENQQARPDVIVVTAARDVETLRGAIRLGALHYVVKPFTFAMLQEKLERYLAWRDQPTDNGIIDQRAVDQLVASLHGHPTSRELPKGLSEETLDLIEGIVRKAGGEMTSSEVGMAAGVSRVTARRYLDFLNRSSLVHMRSRYGASGRPQHLYSAQPDQRAARN